MIENVKTIVLAVLVAASLVQSYLLAYSSPKFDAIIPTDYVESKLEGTQADLKQMLFPKDIVLHFGEDRHTVLYPDMTFYQMIMDVVKQRTFDGFRKAPLLGDLSGQNPRTAFGLEIRFPSAIPFPLLQQMMQVKGDARTDEISVERIWIFTQADRDEVRVFFIGGGGDGIYEATKADLTVKDVERFVGFGVSRAKYEVFGERHYLPLEPLQMVRYEMDYSTFTAEQLQRSLFPDPFNTRILRERNGSEIYTDGKRGLQLSSGLHWMSYSDPAAPVESKHNELDTALSAVQFVNRHGGWNGTYMLSSLKRESDVSSEQTLTFRQYSGSYPGAFPVLSASGKLPFGTIRVTLQNGVVTAYERSVIQLEEASAQRKLTELPGGETLRKKLESYKKLSKVRNVMPAYRIILSEESGKAVLEPIWALELTDGTFEALTGKG